MQHRVESSEVSGLQWIGSEALPFTCAVQPGVNRFEMIYHIVVALRYILV